MTFVLFKIAWAILRPGNLAVLALILGLTMALAGGRAWRRLGQALAVAAAAFFAALTFLPLGSWVTVPLEYRLAASELPERVDGIVILGGPIHTALTRRHGVPSLNEAGERVLVGLELARRYPAAKVVYTGGSGQPFVSEGREADVAREIFASFGLTGPRFIFERDSRNTRENAVLTKGLAEPGPGDVWLLVTSAAHMPRSLAVFEAVDWPLLPYPVDYRTGGFTDPATDMALESELQLFEYGVREWLGLTAYRLRGWTRTFWPQGAQPSSG
jgi:uncharacterized SAM-binding protein YcdF (DUF218 family)